MAHEIANISKTVRFTPSQWHRWKRLFVYPDCRTWADVVVAGLQMVESELIDAGKLPALNGELDVLPKPLFDEPEAPPAPPLELPKFEGNCKKCGKPFGNFEPGKDGECVSCELIALSGGKLTTAAKMKAPKKPTPAKRTTKPTAKATKPARAGKDKGKRPAKAKAGA